MVKVTPYVCCVPRRDFLYLRERYHPRLYISQDFKRLTQIPDSFMGLSAGAALTCENDARDEASVSVPSTVSATSKRKWNARVMLLSESPCLNEYTADSHVSRLIKFLIAKKSRSGLMALGGAWNAEADGGDPDKDVACLAKTAIRCVKELVDIDLTACTRWEPFMQIDYHRREETYKGKTYPEQEESTVFFVPDVAAALPSPESYEALLRARFDAVRKQQQEDKVAKAKAEAKLMEQAAKLKAEAEAAKAKAEAQAAKAKAEAEAKAKAEAEAKAKAEAEAKAKAEAEEYDPTAAGEEAKTPEEPIKEEAKEEVKEEVKEEDVAMEDAPLVFKTEDEFFAEMNVELEAEEEAWTKFRAGFSTAPCLFARTRKAATPVRGQLISLDGLLDYNEDDKMEKTFEVSLFAELFNERLQRDAAAMVVAALDKAEAPENKAKDKDAGKRKRDDGDGGDDKRARGGDGKAEVAKTEDKAEDKAEAMAEDKAEGEQQGEEKAAETTAAEAEAAAQATKEAETAAIEETFEMVEKDEADHTETYETVRVAGSEPMTSAQHVQVDEPLLKAFRFFDRTDMSYIYSDDLQTIVHSLGTELSSRQVQALVQHSPMPSHSPQITKVSQGRARVDYHKLTHHKETVWTGTVEIPKPEPPPAAAEAEAEVVEPENPAGQDVEAEAEATAEAGDTAMADTAEDTEMAEATE